MAKKEVVCFQLHQLPCLVMGLALLLCLVLFTPSLEGSDYYIYGVCKVSLLEVRSFQFVMALLIDTHSHKSIIPAERKLGL